MKKLVLYERVLKNDLDFLKQDVSLKREGAVVLLGALSVEVAGSIVPHYVMKQFISGPALYVLSAGAVMLSALGAAKTMLVLSDRITVPKVKKFKNQQNVVAQELNILIKELEHSFDIKTTLEILQKANIELHNFKSIGGTFTDYTITFEDTTGCEHQFTQRVSEIDDQKPFIETFQRRK